MDRAAFDGLYRQHYPRVLGICRRLLGGISDAEDAAQEVFMRAFRALGRYDQKQPFGAWIGAIASNHCIDRLRQRQRLGKVFADTETLPEAEDPASAGADVLITSHRAEVIGRAVDALPEAYRLPIVMAYYADASHDEIAATLGITRNHVGVLLLRGRRRLRSMLADPGATT